MELNLHTPMVDIGGFAPDADVKMTTENEINLDFSLKQAYEKNEISVFYFFPAAFTGVCTSSSCQLRDDIKEFSDIGADIYGISTDMPFSQKIFIQQNEINYPLLSDWNKEMIIAFEVVDDKFAGYFRGVAKRSLFAIQNEKIIFKWIADNPGQYPPFDDLKDTLQMTIGQAH